MRNEAQLQGRSDSGRRPCVGLQLLLKTLTQLLMEYRKYFTLLFLNLIMTTRLYLISMIFVSLLLQQKPWFSKTLI